MKRVSSIRGELCAVIMLCEEEGIKDLLCELHKIPLFQETIDRFIKDINEVRFSEWLNEDAE